MVFEHTSDMQVFQTDHLVLANQFGGHFVLIVSSGIGYLGMQTGNLLSGFFSVLAAFFLSGMVALCSFELLFVAREVLRVGHGARSHV